MSSIMSTLARRSLRFSRLLTTRQQHSSSSSSYLRKPSPSTSTVFNPIRFSSSSAVATKPSSDQRLSRVLESELECAKEERDDLDQLTMGMPINLTQPVTKGGLVPEGFPFEIIDNPGEETITLKRELDGETIEVMVHSPQMAEQDEEDDDEDEDDDKDKSSGKIDMTLIVTVDKGKGTRLEFTCNASPDGITIDSMLLKQPDVAEDDIYEGPEFSDLDENLQKEFYVYLEKRGIKSTLMNFLHEYMMNKDNREYVKWLENMKEFVEK